MHASLAPQQVFPFAACLLKVINSALAPMPDQSPPPCCRAADCVGLAGQDDPPLEHARRLQVHVGPARRRPQGLGLLRPLLAQPHKPGNRVVRLGQADQGALRSDLVSRSMRQPPALWASRCPCCRCVVVRGALDRTADACLDEGKKTECMDIIHYSVPAAAPAPALLPAHIPSNPCTSDIKSPWSLRSH